jgi:hypothetical protein
VGKTTKTINVSFEDDEFEDLTAAKGNESWHDFILSKAPAKVKAK